MLQECFSMSLALGDVFGSSPLYKVMKEIMDEKDSKIRELESKFLEGRKVQHLGCDMEIQTLKSRIADLEKELKGPAAAMSAIPILPNKTKLREKGQEKEIHNLKCELTDVKNQLKHTRDKLEVKEEQESTKYKKNVEMLNKLMLEKNVFLEIKKKFIER